MNRLRSLRRNLAPDPPPGLAEYGSLYVLLLALAVSETLLGVVVRAVTDLRPFRVSPRIFGTVGYAVLGLGALGIGLLAYREARDADARLDDSELGALAAAVCLLVLGVLYAALGRVGAPGPGSSVLGGFLTAVVGAGLAVAYLRVRGSRLRLDFDGVTVPTLSVAALVPVLVVAAVAVLSLLVVRSGGGTSPWPLGGRYVRPPSAVHLLESAVLASLFSAFGMGVLFHGAVQETLRERASPAAAVAAVTTLVGVYRLAAPQALAPPQALARADGVASLAVALAVALVVLVAVAAVVATAALVARLWEAFGSTVVGDRSETGAGPVRSRETATAAATGVAAVAVLLGVSQAFVGPFDASVVGYALGYAATVGVAAAAYERSRSVWVPVLALAAFHVAADVLPALLFLAGAFPG